MSQWFPAIRAALNRRGIHLPQPYPHTGRTLLGSALAALLSGSILGILYLAYSLACFTIDITEQAAESISRTTTELASSLSSSPDKAEEVSADSPAVSNDSGKPDVPSQDTSAVPVVSRKVLLPDDARLQEIRTKRIFKDLPYSETRRISFADAARQVDFALVQTVLRLNIERGRIMLLASETREQNGEQYQYQRIRIFLPPVAEGAAEGHPFSEQAEISASNQTSRQQSLVPRRIAVDSIAEFVGTLEENLDAWAIHGSLSERPGKITLSVGNVVTHEIWLDVTTKKFLPAPTESRTPSPRLVIVMNEMGNDPNVVSPLLTLPFPVTFSIIPSGSCSRETAEKAWQAGLEILIQQPMQSVQWPYVKAGPEELTVDMSEETIAAILHDALEKVPHASGLSNHMGSELSGDRKASARVVTQTAAAGLYLLDGMARQDSFLYPEAVRLRMPAWTRSLPLDEGHPSAHVVLSALEKAEQLAIEKGYAIVTGRPYPETLKALQHWATGRNQSVEIVPLWALPDSEIGISAQGDTIFSGAE